MNRHVIQLFVVTLCSVAVVGCGATRSGGAAKPGGGAAAPTSARLQIAGYAFHPKTLTVRAGAKIIVTNGDQTAHTATSTSGAFDSGTLKPGQTLKFTLSKPGVYRYYCQFHAFMTGTIRVVR